jgi:cobalt-zinc-cadmium efflux system outer membrane protein
LGLPITDPPKVFLPNLVQLALQQNPLLQQAGFDLAAAQGKAIQAGLYPNPVLSGVFDEMGDVQADSGIVTLPMFTQEIVTAGKLKLDRAAAARQTDITQFGLARERIQLITEVRKQYFKVLALQRRLEVLEELVKLAFESVKTAEKLLEAKQIAELDLLQFRVEYNRLAAKLDAAQRERLAAWRQLAATVGSPLLPLSPLAGSLEVPLPEPDFDATRALVLERRPEVQAAQVEIVRAELLVKRAEVQKIPNVTVGAGYVRQNQNKSDDWVVQFSLPIPIFDRNQGNVQAARAQLARAIQEVRRVELDLSEKLALAFGQYTAGLQQAERYREGVLKDAEKAYKLSLVAFKGGQFEYLRVISSQQAFAQAKVEYIEFLAQVWQGASEIAGLVTDEDWPVCHVGAPVAPALPPPK